MNQLVGYGYDAAGNLTQEGSGSPSWIYTYDAENRISSIAGSASETFKYDGDGERVYKSYGAIFWRLPGGPFLSKASLSGTIGSEHIYFGGRHIAIVNGTTPYYLFPDHLGGEHVVTNASGTICNDIDTLPFGGEIDYTASCGPSYLFAGMDRGNENSSNLDYAINRYYDLRAGRFMTPDSFYKDSHVGDPQSWNEYAYARNNPLRYVDPTGQKATVSSTCTTDANNQTTCSVKVSASIAIYAQSGSGLTQEQLNQAAGTIQNTIQNAWSGSFTQDGVTYNVTTQVTVSVANSEDAAVKSGAQNIVGLSNGPADAAHNINSEVFTKSPGTKLFGGPDRGIWNFNTLGSDSGHEFTHLLGTFDKPGAVLSEYKYFERSEHPTYSD